jgi:hypothetical protein
MTLLTTIHLGDYAIIASDRKEVFKFNGTVIPRHENADKLIETGIGLITGSGYVALLNAVKERVAVEDITHTDQILNIITSERWQIRHSPLYSEYQKNEFLNFTCWLLSYRTIADKSQYLRIALYHPCIDENHFGIIQENTTKAVFPSDFSKADVDKYSNYLSQGFRKLNDISDINQNISHNIQITLVLMDLVAQISEYVSKACDIGLVFKNGDMYMVKDVSVESSNLSLQKF